MTNKTDDMPQVIYLSSNRPYGEQPLCSLTETYQCNVKYTRSVEITDERIKAALDCISAQEAGCTGYRIGELCKDEIEIICQALSDYGQMVECINDLTSVLLSTIQDRTAVRAKHGEIIHKCRGKDNG